MKAFEARLLRIWLTYAGLWGAEIRAYLIREMSILITGEANPDVLDRLTGQGVECEHMAVFLAGYRQAVLDLWELKAKPPEPADDFPAWMREWGREVRPWELQEVPF